MLFYSSVTLASLLMDKPLTEKPEDHLPIRTPLRSQLVESSLHDSWHHFSDHIGNFNIKGEISPPKDFISHMTHCDTVYVIGLFKIHALKTNVKDISKYKLLRYRINFIASFNLIQVNKN